MQSRGQYALEAMLLTAAFFAVMAGFAGMYVRFSDREADLGAQARLRLDGQRLAGAVNDVYVLGRGNSVEVEVGLANYTLDYAGGKLILEASGRKSKHRVFGDLDAERRPGQHVVVKNAGSKVSIRKK